MVYKPTIFGFDKHCVLTGQYLSDAQLFFLFFCQSPAEIKKLIKSNELNYDSKP